MDHPIARFVGTIIGLIVGLFIAGAGLALAGFTFIVLLGWSVAGLSPLHHSTFVEATTPFMTWFVMPMCGLFFLWIFWSFISIIASSDIGRR
jgi:hypothetical protein